MSILPSLRPLVALVAAAALGGAAAVGAVAVLGGLEGDTTVLTETAEAPETQAAPAKPSGAMSINEIYERTAPGVVQINSTSGSGVALPTSRALGSGFVVDKAGHIVTNFHVIDGADAIRVGFSNRDSVEAELVGTDQSTDLAVLRVDASATALTPLPLGDSDRVRVGDRVVAIGNPFGLDRTATAGIVSALQRLITAPNQFTIDHVIQTDAPINQGNSGGPLIDDRGQVIGVNTQIETGGVSTGNVGIGFAVPSNTVKDVVAQILRTGRVDHAYLGIRGTAVTPEVAETYNLPVDEGVLVADVAEGSGAEKAGLDGGETDVVVAGQTYTLGGDIIVGIDGESVSSVEELRDAIAEHEPGQKVRLTVLRGDKRTSVTVTLGRQPSSPKG
jgi:S1-C subfamily serine protease